MMPPRKARPMAVRVVTLLVVAATGDLAEVRGGDLAGDDGGGDVVGYLRRRA